MTTIGLFYDESYTTNILVEGDITIEVGNRLSLEIVMDPEMDTNYHINVCDTFRKFFYYFIYLNNFKLRLAKFLIIIHQF